MSRGEENPQTGDHAERFPRLLPLVATALLGLALSLAFAFRSTFDVDWDIASFRHFVDGLGLWGPIVYVVLIACRFIVLIPSSILLVASGLCFGALPGTIYAALGLTLSGLLKFAVASIVGRDAILRRLPDRYQERIAHGNQIGTMGGLTLICAYPFGPKHIFQLAAIFAGISLPRYAFAVAAGSTFRAAAFASLGRVLLTGDGAFGISAFLIVIGALPLASPRFRAAVFSSATRSSPLTPDTQP